jgi:hypothetical protein
MQVSLDDASKVALLAREVCDRWDDPKVGMLYKHFQVSSRSELLAYFVRREPVRRQRQA